MTDYTGTNGNDKLTGTSADDRFYPKLGVDTIADGGGNDALYLDYSGVNTTGKTGDYLVVNSTSGQITGQYYETYPSKAPNNTANFSAIHSLNFVGWAVSDMAYVAPAAAASNAQLSLDGSAGMDNLYIDFSQSLINSFVVGSNATVSNALGTFKNWETYNLTFANGDNTIKTGDGSDSIIVGSGNNSIDAGSGNNYITAGSGNNNISLRGDYSTVVAGSGNNTINVSGVYSYSQITVGSGNNIINTGGGDDYIVAGAGTNQIHAGGGTDSVTAGGTTGTIDGGAGTDTLIANYGKSTAPIVFDETAGTLNNATVTGFEFFNLTGGSGNDVFRFVDVAGLVDGGKGADTLVVDDRANTAASQDVIVYGVDPSASRYELKGSLGGALSFSAFEKLTYMAGSGDDALIISPDPVQNPGDISLDGGAGQDALTLGAAARLVFIEHQDGSITSNAGTFAHYEKLTLTGSGGDDQLGGSGTIAGGSGNDIVSGGPGASADTLDGGAGIDTLSYAEAQAGVHVSLLSQGTAQDTIGAGTDKLSGFENLTGSAHDDALTGDGRANVIEGGAGNDRLDGGGGNDTVSYAGAAAGVTVNLNLSRAQDTGGAGTDTLARFGNVTGSNYHDTLIGDANANVLDGRGGDDVLKGGLGDDTYIVDSAHDMVVEAADGGSDTIMTYLSHYGLGADVEKLVYTGTGVFFGTGNALDNTIEGGSGDDTLDGGGGSDTVSYADAFGGVRVSLALTGPQDTQSAGIDTLSHFQQIIGSSYGDRLTGDAGRNIMRGGDGDDLLNGGDGNDYLYGAMGADTLNGGAGADRFVYMAASEAGPALLTSGLPGETIGDFSHAEGDHIDLARIDPDPTAAGDQGFTFIGGAAFTGAGGTNHEVREYQNQDGSYTVAGDVDHDGIADFAIHVISSTALVASDFIL